MFGAFHQRTAVVFVLMMLLAPLTPAVELDPEFTSPEVSQRSVDLFADGADNQTLMPNGTAEILHEAGHRLDRAEVQLTIEPTSSAHTEAISLRAGLFRGDAVNVSEVPTGIALVEPRTGPDGAGLSSRTIMGNASLNGSHAYDTLTVWGNLTTAGTLTLVVNTLIVQTGGKIWAQGLVTQGTGPGGSTNGYGADGAGGGGHALRGGAGGNQYGASGGVRYGNGSEMGSTGGDANSPYHVNALGGHGGGFLTIRAGTIIVNGSITAAGDDAMDGRQASSGSGHGGSGGGGGSGGTVDVRCNTLTVGSYGNILADGGDGGDGGNGAQNGPGIGMHDGGDGGGGGSGGFVLIATQAGGFANNGVVSALGGAGGSGGALYGSGRNGVAGHAGGVGNVNLSNWAGYPVYATAANHGSFTLDKWAPDNGTLVDGDLVTLSSIPATGAISLEFRHTVLGDGFTDDHWSEWTPIGLNDTLPRLTWIQLRWTLTRDANTTSPVLQGVQVDHVRWHGIEDPVLTIEERVAHARPGEVGLTSTGTISTVSARATTLHIPLSDGTPLSDLQLWLDWDADDAGASLEVSHASGVLHTTDLADRPAGHGVAIDVSGLALSSGSLVLDLTTTVDANLSIAHIHLPYTMSTSVDLAPTLDAHMVGTCGEAYLATAACLTSYGLRVDGDVNGSTLFRLTDLDLSWTDDIAPRLASAETPASAPQRVLDSIRVEVRDVAAEPGISGTAAWPGEAPVALAWDSSVNAYTAYLASTHLDPKADHTVPIDIVLTDAHGNSDSFPAATSLTLHESLPEVGDLRIVPLGETLDLGENRYGAGTASFRFEATDTNGREDLVSALHLGPEQGPSLEMPLVWSAEHAAYTSEWVTDMSDIGLWTLEVELREDGGLQGFDADGLAEGVDATVEMVDEESPVLTRFAHPDIVMLGETFDVDIAWMAWTGESVSGTLALMRGETLLHMADIPLTAQQEVRVTFDTRGYGASDCTLVLNLEDAAGNAVLIPEWFEDAVEITDRVWIEGDWNTATLDGINLSIGGDHLFRTRGGLLDVTVNGARALTDHPIADSGWELNISLLETLPGVQVVEATLCDQRNDTVCQTWDTTVNLDGMLAIHVDHNCIAPDREVELDQNITVISCHVKNRAALDLVLDLDGDAVTLATLAQHTFEVVVNTSEIGGGLTHEWMLSATNLIGAQELLEQGVVNLTFPSEEEEAPAATGEESGLPWLWIGLGAGLLLALLGATLMLRGGIEEDDFWPEIDAQPTSYDELGNEWYSTPEGAHWHRPAGLQEEWTQHEG